MNNPSYLWILRCVGGENINRSVEYKLIDEAPKGEIIPLLEVINEVHLSNFYPKLKRKYGEVWVDLPYYLSEHSNKFQESVDGLITSYKSSPATFFLTHKNNLDVPVVSAPDSYSFDSERAIYNSIKDEFYKIAVRVRVPTVDITTAMESSLKQLVNAMRIEDVLLLDVFQFSSVESQVTSNIKKMNNIAQQKNIGVYVLNAFETFQANCHNYGPLLTAYFSLVGFGDFATEERFKPARAWGGRASIIRYYVPSSYDLWFCKEKAGYDSAKGKLVKSGHWANTSTTQHRSRCTVCDEVNKNKHNKDHIYWKRFKILHYLNCIANEMITQHVPVNTAEDLDPDGYNTIVKLGGEVKS